MPALLHICYSGLGGTTDYVINLIKGDKENIFDHHIIFYGIEDVAKHTLSRIDSETSASYSVIVKKRGLDKEAISNLKYAIEKLKPAAVTLHVNSLILHLPKLLPKNCKLIFVEHQANHLKSRKEWVWSTLAQRKADLIVSLTTDYHRMLYEKSRFLFKRKKNTVINTGLDLSAFSAKREDRPIKKIGMISRINDFRDHETLVEAFLKLNAPDLELHIAGDGPLLEYYKLKFADQSQIKWLGHLNHEAVITLLNDLDIYVHATLGETSSIAIMQAQASGLPIIASDVSGVNNFLKKENGILVEPGDVNALAGALESLLSDVDLRRTLSWASRLYAETNLDNERMFNEYKNLIL